MLDDNLGCAVVQRALQLSLEDVVGDSARELSQRGAGIRGSAEFFQDLSLNGFFCWRLRLHIKQGGSLI